MGRSRREMSAVMPRGARWIKSAVERFEPDTNTLVLDNGATIHYEYLIVATGMKLRLDKIPGLEEALQGDHGVATIWDHRYVTKAWEYIRTLGLRDPELKNGGVALFTQPLLGRGCGGASQKIAWLAEDWWRTKTMVRPNLTVEFVSGRPALFPVPKYADALAEIAKERDVHVRCNTELVAVDGPNRIATFQDATGKRIERKYDFLHVTPRMCAPPVIEGSPLADSTGYVDVDKHTLQHVRYANVFAIGDSANVPTSRTIAAITAQAPVLVHNLIVVMGEETASQMARYDGYSSSPILTRRGGLILAEFKYGDGPGAPPAVKETFPYWFDQGKEVSVFYALQTGLFPWVRRAHAAALPRVERQHQAAVRLLGSITGSSTRARPLRARSPPPLRSHAPLRCGFDAGLLAPDADWQMVWAPRHIRAAHEVRRHMGDALTPWRPSTHRLIHLNFDVI